MPRERLSHVLAEMVANVLEIEVAPGDVVQEGDVLVELLLAD